VYSHEELIPFAFLPYQKVRSPTGDNSHAVPLLSYYHHELKNLITAFQDGDLRSLSTTGTTFTCTSPVWLKAPYLSKTGSKQGLEATILWDEVTVSCPGFTTVQAGSLFFLMFPQASDPVADSTDFKRNTVTEQTKTSDTSRCLGRKVLWERKHWAGLCLYTFSSTSKQCPIVLKS